MSNIPTPHIEAKQGQIAKTVLLAGDPKRVTLMAGKLLKNAKCVNNIRGNVCYTGLYKGRKVSIMSCGMGAGSMGIYSYELYNFYNVENIIRVGTAGSIKDSLKLGDVVVAGSVTTDTNLYRIFAQNGGDVTFLASKKLSTTIKNLPSQYLQDVKFGKVYSSDSFYGDNNLAVKSGALCVEMEAGALYASARKFKKDALAILTISDEILTGKRLSSKERESSVESMFNLALTLATKC